MIPRARVSSRLKVWRSSWYEWCRGPRDGMWAREESTSCGKGTCMQSTVRWHLLNVEEDVRRGAWKGLMALNLLVGGLNWGTAFRQFFWEEIWVSFSENLAPGCSWCGEWPREGSSLYCWRPAHRGGTSGLLGELWKNSDFSCSIGPSVSSGDCIFKVPIWSNESFTQDSI